MSAPSILPRLFAAPAPSAGIEIASDRVTGVVLDRERRVTAAVDRPLPVGAVVPAANAANIAEPDTVREVVREVRRALPGAPRRVALVVPDSAAKVSLLPFEKVPARAGDLDRLVRWQARKTAPFRIEDAQVAWTPGAPLVGGGRVFVVSLMRRDIVEEYEGACASGGGHAGVVDLASFGLINAVLAAGPPAGADWLLVHAAGGYRSVSVVRDGSLILFRHRPATDDDDFVDLVHQTTMYYEDRLDGGGYGRILLAVTMEGADADDADHLRGLVETHLGAAVAPIAMGQPAGAAESGGPLPDVTAAAAGLLLREHTPGAAGA